MVDMLVALFQRALGRRRTERSGALTVTEKQRRLRDAIITLGIDLGSMGMMDELHRHAMDVHYGPMGEVMDEMYAERMLDGRISS